MGFFDAIRQWFQGFSSTWEGDGATLADDPPVRFDDGEPAHGLSAAEVFERFCRLSLCIYVEAMDARDLLGASDSALAGANASPKSATRTSARAPSLSCSRTLFGL